MPIILPLSRQKWKHQDFKTSLDNEISYISPCLKKKNKKQPKQTKKPQTKKTNKPKPEQ